MLNIFFKEINSFFSSLIGYIVIAVFLIVLWLVMFVFPETSLLDDNYASLDQLFNLAPTIFMFLIPAITMRTFAEEKQSGTMELLATRPVSDLKIIFGKYLAALGLAVFAILPTLLYFYTVYQLGAPQGNIDSGEVWGSYIGLVFLTGTFVSIGVFASSLSKDQIVAFILSTFLCFIFYSGFDYLSLLPLFVGKVDDVIQMIGIDYHYSSMSRGVLDTRDLVYFISTIGFFLMATLISLESRKW